MLRAEIRLQAELRKAGITTGPEYARNLALRGGYRLVPWRLRRSLYTNVVATRFEPVIERPPVTRVEPAYAA